MEKKIKNQIRSLIRETRVMTLAVSNNNLPWSSPVYFVFHDNAFYFFSNETSKHISYAEGKKKIAASIFKDSDQMDLIFGFQMSGVLEKVSKKTLHLLVVKKYVTKFNFLTQVFRSRPIENRNFFFEKFKSHLYCFHPDKIYLSDNSKATGKRSKIDLSTIKKLLLV